MTTTIAIIIILGLLANALFTKLKLPGLLGMLILGICTGPYVLNWLDADTLKISAELRQLALIIILLRAGLGISRDSLNKVGSTALKLSFIPGLIEGFTVALVSMTLLGFTFVQGGVLGFIIAAVSPAVVVPQMLDYLKLGIGTNKNIPTLILAGSSLDDVFAITIFGGFIGLSTGHKINLGLQLLNIPLSIILGLLLGGLAGLLLTKLFSRYHIRDTKKVLVLLGAAIFLTTIEGALKNNLAIAGLLGVMSIGFVLLESNPLVAKRLSLKLDKIWIFAEIVLFVLIGAQVNISVALDSGLTGLAIITIGLLARSLGVVISTWGTNLNPKEVLFCVFAYTPKATVQAAIGAIPLSLGIPGGEIILAIAVLSILITAPLGSVLIKTTAKKLLTTSK